MASLIVVVIFMFILVVRVIAIENDNKLRRQSLLSKFHLVTLTESPTLHLPTPIVISSGALLLHISAGGSPSCTDRRANTSQRESQSTQRAMAPWTNGQFSSYQENQRQEKA